MKGDEARAKDVDDYIAKAPEFARPMCRKLRDIVRQAAPDLREEIKWGSPMWVGRGVVCGMGAFKAHVSLHFFKGQLLKDPDGVLTHGEGNASAKSVKFTELGEIVPKRLEKLIREAVKVDADEKAKAAPRVKRPELPVPHDLAEAMEREPAAHKYWGTLPPSCRREYIEWITSAKREETRAKRLEEAMVMLSAGRRRHEQYK